MRRFHDRSFALSGAAQRVRRARPMILARASIFLPRRTLYRVFNRPETKKASPHFRLINRADGFYGAHLSPRAGAALAIPLDLWDCSRSNARRLAPIGRRAFARGVNASKSLSPTGAASHYAMPAAARLADVFLFVATTSCCKAAEVAKAIASSWSPRPTVRMKI